MIIVVIIITMVAVVMVVVLHNNHTVYPNRVLPVRSIDEGRPGI